MMIKRKLSLAKSVVHEPSLLGLKSSPGKETFFHLRRLLSPLSNTRVNLSLLDLQFPSLTIRFFRLIGKRGQLLLSLEL